MFTHPDDEGIVGPLLARSARHRRTRLVLAIVTNGDKGVTPFANIPAGEQLAAAREKGRRKRFIKVKCSCGSGRAADGVRLLTCVDASFLMSRIPDGNREVPIVREQPIAASVIASVPCESPGKGSTRDPVFRF